jgi:cell division protein FtsQ
MSARAIRRRKAGAAGRLRPYWIVGLLAMALAAGIGYFLVTWPALRPRAIAISGNSAVSRAQIAAAAAVDANENLWLQNPREMAARIERIPDIDRAYVRRIPPATLAIHVTERVPFAVIRTRDRSVVVDQTLRVLGDTREGIDALPALEDPGIGAAAAGQWLLDSGLRALRDDQAALAAAHLNAAILEHDRFGGLVVKLRDGITILLGDESNLPRTIPLVDPILRQVVARNRQITAIDLRAPSTPVVVYKR